MEGEKEREIREWDREKEDRNHSLGVLLVLWSLFLFLFLSVERSVFRGTGEEERGCERQRGRIGIRICTLTKSRPTTTQRTLCVSSLQHLSVSSHLKPTTGRLLSTLSTLCLYLLKSLQIWDHHKPLFASCWTISLCSKIWYTYRIMWVSKDVSTTFIY